MEKQVYGYRCIVDYATQDVMVQLYGRWCNARNALACQAWYDLQLALFGEEA